MEDPVGNSSSRLVVNNFVNKSFAFLLGVG